MAVEIGSILEGKVTGVKKFGAFVSLPSGDTGMVHISEVSNEYIEELDSVLTEGQDVKVKVLSVSPEGKIALSIKKCEPRPARAGNGARPNHHARPNNGARNGGRADTGRVWQPRQSATVPQSEMSFEDMMSQYKTRSEEKISDLKRVTEARRGGGYTRRGH